MNKIDNIKNLYYQVLYKVEFKQLIADEFGKSYGTVDIHWFSRGWSIPEQYQDRVIELLQNSIRQQIERMRNAINYN